MYDRCAVDVGGHLSVDVGDSSQCNEEIVKNFKLCLSVRCLL